MTVPPRKENRKRNKLIQFRCDDAEFAQAKRRAQRAGYTVGAFARACILDGPGPRAQRLPPTNKAELVKLHAELNKIGSNLNQMARAMNSGAIPPLKSVDSAIEAYSDMRADVRRALGLADDQGDDL
jgi:hypothetical protein